MQDLGSQTHSTAWIVQAWASFIVALSATSVGIIYLPVDNWVKRFMGMGLAFSVGSTFSVAKTTRDLHAARKLAYRLDEARTEKILKEHNPLN
ncbi:YiaA/YiaB family inner membrane protein [Chroococcidiopsis sp. CCMEE 29]|uniref:YiaA/YiaB family inner membrane protein n=1 Tax=Chroococcidiopsis sp. CCMEE 29 TaxID=155894 RepID=UPI0020218EFC|nr:YiaA/YiaB family inner membrane protein [Chroococcidiopsis sp. CCMEE 29]